MMQRDSDFLPATEEKEPSKMQNDEAKFNELLDNVNYILFYLYNVEVQKAQ